MSKSLDLGAGGGVGTSGAEVEVEGSNVLAVAPFRIPFNGVFSPGAFELLEALGLFSSLLAIGSGSVSSSTMLMGTRRR